MPDNDKNTNEIPSLRDVLESHYTPGTTMTFKANDIVFAGSNQGVKKLSVEIVAKQSDGSRLFRFLNQSAQET